MSYSIGSLIVFAKKFTDAAAADADPTVVKFFLREELDGTELEWTYAAVPVQGTDYPTGMNPVVKDSTGDYHVNWIARKAERQTGRWRGSGVIFQASETVEFVRHSALALAEP